MLGYGVIGSEELILKSFFTYTDIPGETLSKQKENFMKKYSGENITNVDVQFANCQALDTWNDISDFSVIPLKDAKIWFIGKTYYFNDTLDTIEKLEDLITLENKQNMQIHLKKMNLSIIPKFFLSANDFTNSTL